MKKFLSMVLALAMAMSLVTFSTVSAGAKDFTDGDTINYKEAADVISAINIMDGYEDNSFRPSGTLTRGAAAKIICNMILGPTTASALPTNVAPFPDVAPGSVFAGYIAYCSEHQIISGYADGNFRPSDSLSGYAFLKMLLCALGYDQEIEKYQGANWRVNVAKQALGIGLDDGLIGELDGSRIVTREEAALYAFNTLQADMVEYDTKTTVSVSGATVTVGGNTFHTKTSQTQNTKNGHIDGRAQNGQLIIQFAEEYFPNLERFPKKENDFTGGQDKFGRPSTRWMWKGVEVGTYEVAPAKVYYGDPKPSEIYNDLGLAGTVENAVVWLNGYEVFRLDIKRANDDALHEQPAANITNNTDRVYGYAKNADGTDDTTKPIYGFAHYADKVGDGTIYEVFHDDDENRIVICAMSVYPGQINSTHAASSTKDAYVVIDYKGNGGADYVTANYAKNDYDEFETDARFEEDDIVWFTFSESDKEIGEAHVMESVEGTLDRRVSGSSATLNGNKYDYAKEVGFDFGTAPNYDSAMTTNSSYIVYLDQSGRALYVEESEFAADQYALIERISVEGPDGSKVLYSSLSAAGVPTINDNNSWDSNMVRLLTASGVERTVDLDGSSRYRTDTKNGNVIVNSQIAYNYLAGSIVRYTEQSDGTYRLYTVSGAASQARSAYADEGIARYSISNNHVESGLYLYDKTVGATYGNTDASGITQVRKAITNTTARSDSETIFVVKDDDVFRVYDGLRNAPQMTNNDAQAYAYCTGTNPKAKVVFIIRGTTVNSSKDITFLAGKSRSDYFVEDGDNYYEYTAMIKGSMETVYVRYDEANPTVFNMYNRTNNVDNFVLSMNPADGDAAWNSVLLNSTYYDNDDFMTSGSFASNTLSVYRTMGIKKANRTDEIKVGTYDGTFNTGKTLSNGQPNIIVADERTEYLSSSCNIYYVDDDGNVSAISYDAIHNDVDDVIYYTLDDDAEVTNIFICDFEP